MYVPSLDSIYFYSIIQSFQPTANICYTEHAILHSNPNRNDSNSNAQPQSSSSLNKIQFVIKHEPV